MIKVIKKYLGNVKANKPARIGEMQFIFLSIMINSKTSLSGLDIVAIYEQQNERTLNPTTTFNTLRRLLDRGLINYSEKKLTKGDKLTKLFFTTNTGRDSVENFKNKLMFLQFSTPN